MLTIGIQPAEVHPEVMRSTQKVLLINTRNAQSDLLEPNAYSDSEEEKYKQFAKLMFLETDDLHKEGIPPFDFWSLDHDHMKLSADQGCDDWVALAKLIEKKYDDYSGFVIQNGTDDIVLCATALSFMLQNLGKPVIFTGSLIPGAYIYSDMKRNAVLALTAAQSTEISEVCLLFDEHLFRANRTIRVSGSTLCPFDSPHYPVIGSVVNGELIIQRELLRRFPTGRLRVQANLDTKVLTLQLGPGMSKPIFLRFARATAAKAIILYCYGSGNGPTRDSFMKDFLSICTRRNIIVVICTQNRYGSVSLSEYEAGRQMMDEGVLSAGSMTHETALIKLKYLFGRGYGVKRIREEFVKDLRGEISSLQSHL